MKIFDKQCASMLSNQTQIFDKEKFMIRLSQYLLRIIPLCLLYFVSFRLPITLRHRSFPVYSKYLRGAMLCFGIEPSTI